MAITWWLGLDTSCGSICLLCRGRVPDPLGHHALTCKRGGNVVTHHNKLRDTLAAETCRRAHQSVKVEAGSNHTHDHSHTHPADILVPRAHQSVKVEAGSNHTHDHSHTHPADILVPSWSMGKPAAFDLSVMSLNFNVLLEAGLAAGQAARATEQRKHEENDAKCKELGWVCVPMVVEAYDAWGDRSNGVFVLRPVPTGLRLRS